MYFMHVTRCARVTNMIPTYPDHDVCDVVRAGPKPMSRCSSRAESLRVVAEAEAAADRELDHLMAGLENWAAAEQAGLMRG